MILYNINEHTYLLAVFDDKYKNLPTFYSANINNSIFCPFKSSNKSCKQRIILSASMILNLVNSHKYFQFLFFLSVTMKAVPVFYFNFSY